MQIPGERKIQAEGTMNTKVISQKHAQLVQETAKRPM